MVEKGGIVGGLRVIKVPTLDFILQSQASEISDHCPLVLGLTEGVHGKRRFNFESFWPKIEGFHEAAVQS